MVADADGVGGDVEGRRSGERDHGQGGAAVVSKGCEEERCGVGHWRVVDLQVRDADEVATGEGKGVDDTTNEPYVGTFLGISNDGVRDLGLS